MIALAIIGAIALFVVGLVGAVLVKVIATDVHAWMPHLARRLIKQAVKWRPSCERQDFEDELLDLISGYEADNRKLSSLIVGLNEWQQSARMGGLATWAHSDHSESQALALLWGLTGGLAIGLSGGLIFGFTSGIRGGLISALAIALISLNAGRLTGGRLEGSRRHGLLKATIGAVGVGLFTALVHGLANGVSSSLICCLAIWLDARLNPKASVAIVAWIRDRSPMH